MASNPMRAMGDATDFGAVVAFLCSRQARFITGESVLVAAAKPPLGGTSKEVRCES
ncbi:MAG TPA: SDR family oxidoreductase, partial [Methylomirabilota bacterium]|nr:SDR family oxidoreductase [Methylomirabilota bacterium]